jgi:Ras family protein T1
MQEVEPSQVAEILSSKKRLDQCDLLCFVYDTSDASSFEYVAALRVSSLTYAVFL